LFLLAALASLAVADPALAVTTSQMSGTGNNWEYQGLSHRDNAITNDPFHGVGTIDGVIGWAIGQITPLGLTGTTVEIDQDYSTGVTKYSVVAAGSKSQPATVSGNTLVFVTAGTGKVGGSAYAGAVSAANGSAYQVSDNTLRFDGAAVVAGFAGGGAALSGTVSGNNVVVQHNSGLVDARGLYGGVSEQGGSISGNSVQILAAALGDVRAGVIVGAATAGYAVTASTLSGNYVSIAGEAGQGDIDVTEYVAGAFVTGQVVTAVSHQITGNYVEMSRGTVAGEVAGAYGYHGDTSLPAVAVEGATFRDNHVIITGEVEVTGSVYGAYLHELSGTSNNFVGNYVSIQASGKTGDIIGAFGHSSDEAVSGNYVNFLATGAFTASGDVIGALMLDKASVSDNHVTVSTDPISDPTVVIAGSVIGGATIGAGSSAENNKVTLSGKPAVGGQVVGGYSIGGTASRNQVNIGIEGGQKFAGTVDGPVTGGANFNGDTGSVSDNEVNVYASELKLSGGTMSTVYGGYMTSNGPGEVTGNKVRLTPGSSAGAITGGFLSGTGPGSASGNVVEAAGASVGPVWGGQRDGGTGSANNNSVTLGRSPTPTADEFTQLGGNVFGGWAGNATGNATGNSVTIAGPIALAPTVGTVSLRGGGGTGNGDYTTGNVLTFEGVSFPAQDPNAPDANHAKFGTIATFETIRFTDIAPTPAVLGGAPVVQAGTLDLRVGNDSNTRIEVIEFTSGSTSLMRSQEIVLVKADQIETNGSTVDYTYIAQGGQGITRYDYAITVDGNELKARVVRVYFGGQARALSELPLADVAFLYRAGDDVAYSAIPAAAAASKGVSGFAAFANVGYGKERVNTGSHIDVKGVTGNVGLAVSTDTGAGPATAGIFLEFGRGEFDSYNDFVDASEVHGSGDVTYLGGGLLGRFELGSQESSRPYVEASARIGRTKSDISSFDFMGALGAFGKLELSSRYYGFHGGIGYIIDLLDFNMDGSIDISAKYFHTRRDGDDFIYAGEQIVFGDVTSSRLRAGARFNLGLSDYVRPFVGGYFEREFRGESQVTVGTEPLPKVSLAGNTGIGELGVTLTSPSVPVEVELGVQGYGGKRDGVSGGVKLNYAF
jgi:hypothetical protein